MTIRTDLLDSTEYKTDDSNQTGGGADWQRWSDISRELVFGNVFTSSRSSDQSILLNGFDTKENRFEIQFAQLEPAPVQGTGEFIKESLSDDQKKRMKLFGSTDQENISILKEINRHGKNPAEGIFEIMKNNRVLGIGETHRTPNSQRDLGSKIMDGLRKAGATHFAIEAPAFIQPYLDRFIETGNLEISALPPGLRDQDFINILKAARSAGLKIVAVDANEKYEEANGIKPPADATNRNFPLNRDKEMADNIADILKTPENKVILWVGNAHLQRKFDDVQRTTTAEHLRRNFSVATIRPITDLERSFKFIPLAELSNPINKAVLVPTNETKLLKEMPWTGARDPVYAKSWDYILIHP